jgi:hypothetical protein
MENIELEVKKDDTKVDVVNVNINNEDEMNDVKAPVGSGAESYTYISWEGGYLEKLMEKWCDDAAARIEIHTKAERRNRCLHYSFTIPIVILSIIGGTLNIAINTIFSAEHLNYVHLALGGSGILVGLMETIQNILKYQRLSEAHRLAVAQWNRFQRNIRTVLALDKSCRRNVSEFFRSAKSEMDRLVDSSPSIADEIGN